MAGCLFCLAGQASVCLLPQRVGKVERLQRRRRRSKSGQLVAGKTENLTTIPPPTTNNPTDEQVTMRCAFWALPSASLQIQWLADYSFGARSPSSSSSPSSPSSSSSPSLPTYPSSPNGNFQQAARHLQAAANSDPDKSIVLYDSRMLLASEGPNSGSNSSNKHANKTNLRPNDEQPAEDEPLDDAYGWWAGERRQASFSELGLFGSRVVVRESRELAHSADQSANEWPNRGPPWAVLKESQLVIRAARHEDSAR